MGEEEQPCILPRYKEDLTRTYEGRIAYFDHYLESLKTRGQDNTPLADSMRHRKGEVEELLEKLKATPVCGESVPLPAASDEAPSEPESQGPV